MKILFNLLILCCAYSTGFSQRLLDDVMEETRDGGHAALEQLRGKPFVLEFFSSGCVVCFNEMPRIDKLSRKFEGRFSFVLIGDDTLKLPETYKRFEEKYGLKLNVVFSPSLHKTIKPPYTPYFIWVNKDGVMVAESGGEIVVDSVIDSFLAGREDILKTKAIAKSAVIKDLFVDTRHEFYFRSGFSTAIDSVGSYFPNSIKITEEQPYLQFVNCPLSSLFKLAWLGQTEWLRTDQYYGEVWPSILLGEGVNQQELSRLVCYSLYSRGYKTQRELRSILRQDLERSFGLSVCLRESKMPCWVVRKVDSSSIVVQSRYTFRERKIQAGYDGYSSKAGTFSNFLGWIEYTTQIGTPIFDKTGIQGNVDIEFSAIMTDWNDVLKELKKAGFDVVREMRPMQVLEVFSDRK